VYVLAHQQTDVIDLDAFMEQRVEGLLELGSVSEQAVENFLFWMPFHAPN
jgi:hypothetical protein